MSKTDDTDDIMREILAGIEERQRMERPDYGNVVYCDHHLGVKMVLAKSWGSVQYDETKADANPTYKWFCPKPECIRCYEPTMFGYHWNSGKPGTRMQMSQEKQHRGNHPMLPFMYIGKFGQGRRFMCPLYKCDESGPIVATFVVDEDVPIPVDPLADLRGDEKKRAEEMLVFKAFATASGLSIDGDSPKSGPKDYPDIDCTILGERRWFELGRIIHQEVGMKINSRQRVEFGGFSHEQGTPFVER